MADPFAKPLADALAGAIAGLSANDCPECRQGKHATCAEWSMDDADNVVPCPCAERAHRMVSDPPNTVRIYRVAYIGTEAEEAYWCPICGRVSGAVYRGHGAEHIVPDASR